MRLKEGTPMDIFVDGRKLIFEKYEPGCTFCGEMEDKNIEYIGKNICKSCAEEIFDKAKGKEELF